MQPEFWWWNLDELQKEGFFAKVLEVGTENLRLEFHPERERSLVLCDKRIPRSKDERGEVGDYNVVFPCPPVCP